MADFIQAVINGKKAVATFRTVVDVWPSGNFLLKFVGIQAKTSMLLPVVNTSGHGLHAPKYDVLLSRR